MDKRKKFSLKFVAGCMVIAIAACVALAFGGLRLIYWYLGNCGEASVACSTASWLIDCWWLLFVPFCLLAALLLRRIHDRRYAQITND